VIGSHEAPEKLTLDGSPSSRQAVAELKAECVLPDQTLIQTNKRLNNLMVKQRCYPTLGFKTFGNAQVTPLRCQCRQDVGEKTPGETNQVWSGSDFPRLRSVYACRSVDASLAVNSQNSQ
jgi:hypothetical protein